MNPVLVAVLVAAAWYLAKRGTSSAPLTPAVQPVDEGTVSIGDGETFQPQATADASSAYDGLPPGTPVVYVDGNGQVRETNAVYLSQALAAAVLMRDGAFLPRSEDPPRLAPGTGDTPGNGYLL